MQARRSTASFVRGRHHDNWMACLCSTSTRPDLHLLCNDNLAAVWQRQCNMLIKRGNCNNKPDRFESYMGHHLQSLPTSASDAARPTMPSTSSATTAKMPSTAKAIRSPLPPKHLRRPGWAPLRGRCPYLAACRPRKQQILPSPACFTAE